jgi:hypothetical protein
MSLLIPVATNHASVRNMNIMLSPLIRRIHCVSSGENVYMLEMTMVEVTMAMEKKMKKNPLSNHSTALSRRWLRSLKNSTCQMMTMMINSWRKRKVTLTVHMLL